MMHVSIEHHDGKYPSFNVQLASKEGAEPFLIIKGCRVMSGSKGEFISWPATKKGDGNYWNHCYATDKFNAHVLQCVHASKPPKAAPKAAPHSVAPDADDIPFITSACFYDMTTSKQRRMQRYDF